MPDEILLALVEYVGGVLHPEPHGLYTCVAEN